MVARHSSHVGLVPAVAYLRMSSDKQETSIADQRTELLAYAAKGGFKIVKWYIDEGISGWNATPLTRACRQSLIRAAQVRMLPQHDDFGFVQEPLYLRQLPPGQRLHVQCGHV
jgi:Resolvase, N terminal domain